MRKQELLDAWCRLKLASSDPRQLAEQYNSELGSELESLATCHTNVFVFIADPGVATWRVWTPFLELMRDGRFDIRVSTKLDPRSDLEWCDVLWLEKTHRTPAILDVVKKAKELGKRVIYDNDDWVHGVPASMHFADNVYKTRQPECVERLLSMVDVATFSTETLAKLYAPMVANRSVVLPNLVDLDVWGRAVSPIQKKPGTINIGFEGSPTHYEDLKLIEPALVEVMNRHQNVWFWRFGYASADLKWTPKGFVEDDALAALPQDRVMRFAWDHFPHTLGKYLSILDIGVAPLVDNQFNRAKSPIRIYEHAAFAQPVVASSVNEYEVHGCVSIADTTDEWVTALEELVASFQMGCAPVKTDWILQQQAKGEYAHNWVMEHRSIQNELQIKKWIDVLLPIAQLERYSDE